MPDVPTPAEESAPVDQAMTYIRQHNQDIASEAGNQGESRPPIPYLLVGARDSKGYRGFVSSEPGIEIGSGVANVGSSTKSFTAALILQLDQEGKLSIDDTLADPRWNNVLQWPNGQNITLRMVLAHTAGIPDYEDSTAFATHRLDPDWDPTPQDVIGFARVLPPYFPPGIAWHYSNTGYQILGLVIEAVTGNSYGEELASRFFRPLGLTHTYLYGYQQGPRSEPSYFVRCVGVPSPLPSSSAQEKLAGEAACVGQPPLYLPLLRERRAQARMVGRRHRLDGRGHDVVDHQARSQRRGARRSTPDSDAAGLPAVDRGACQEHPKSARSPRTWGGLRVGTGYLSLRRRVGIRPRRKYRGLLGQLRVPTWQRYCD